MAESEDYLDGLLNSITKVRSDIEQGDSDRTPLFSDAMRVKPDEDFLAASGLDFYLQEKSPKARIRKAYSDTDFLKEFEEELLSGEADKFLEDFELELEQEDGYAAPLSDDSLMDSIENLVTKAKKKAAVQSAADEAIALESTEREMRSGQFDPSESFGDNESVDISLDGAKLAASDVDDNSLEAFSGDAVVDSENDSNDIPVVENDNLDNVDDDANRELSPDEIAALLNGAGDIGALSEFASDEHDEIDALNFPEGTTDGFVSEDSDIALDDLLGNDAAFADLADLLDSDANGEAVEGAGDELDANTAKMVSDSEKLTSQKEETPKGIKGFFAKLAAALFGKDDEDEADEAMASVVSEQAMANMSEEELETLKSLQESDGVTASEDGAKDGGKKKKEKPKKEKKAKEPKPKKEKKPKTPKEPAEKEPKLPTVQIVVSVVLAGSILALTLIVTNMGSYSTSMTNAKKLYSTTNYVGAYSEVLGLKIKKTDEEFVGSLKILAAAQSKYDVYRTSAELKRYDDALDALICGIGRCEANMNNAMTYGIVPQLNAIEVRYVDELEMQFGLSKEDAMDIYSTRRRQDYAKRLNEVLISLNLSESGD